MVAITLASIGFSASRQLPKDDAPLLIFCDVGQGDATLLKIGNFQILVDAGPSPQVMECLDQFMPPSDQTLEIVVASHGDSDHIKGFEAVFSEYLVKEIWLVPLPKKSADFEAFSAAISRKKGQGSKVRWVNQGDVFLLLQQLSITVLSPRVDQVATDGESVQPAETTLSADLAKSSKEVEWENDRSIVLKVIINGVSILLTGDIEKEAEQALVAQGLISKTTILKVAHHGSKTSSITEFLDKAQPEIATVSSGQNNKYGHPSPEVIANLLAKGTKILRTDQLSHIVLEIREEGTVEEVKSR